jgi:2-iminobutanoate/2-iminopropanoate deaminase
LTFNFIDAPTFSISVQNMKIVVTNKAPAAVGPYAQAVAAGDFLYLSGQIPLVPETGLLISENIADQTQQVFRNMEAICNEAGGSLGKIVKCTVFLTDLSNFQVVNEIYAEKFGDHRPARSTLQVSALPRGASVEIEAIMYLK